MGVPLGRGDFSGRKTKNAEVNGMLGIYFNPEDERNGVTRVNWIVRRKGAKTRQEVVVAGCLAAGMPIILSKRPCYKKIEPPTTDTKSGSEDK